MKFLSLIHLSILWFIPSVTSYNSVEKRKNLESWAKSSPVTCGAIAENLNLTRCSNVTQGYLGQVTQPEEWPWMVTVLRGMVPICSGALIGQGYVLTSARCVYRRLPVDLTVEIKCSQAFSKPGTNIYPVEGVKMHPAYDGITNYDDLAILKLDPSIKASAHLSACSLCLPNDIDNITKDQTCLFIGWRDKLESLDKGENNLYDVCQPYIPRNECSSFYGSNFNDETLMCAGFDVESLKLNATDLSQYRGPCDHNIGSPLVCKINNHWTLYGLATNTINCRFQQFPNLYTDIKQYMKWITSNF